MRGGRNRHDWKWCEGHPSVGSNPPPSATRRGRGTTRRPGRADARLLRRPDSPLEPGRTAPAPPERLVLNRIRRASLVLLPGTRLDVGIEIVLTESIPASRPGQVPESGRALLRTRWLR